MGRQFSNLTRNNKGVTVFDEIALSNDINAACAGATVIYQHQKDETGALGTESRLVKLTDLKKRGIVTEDEYSRQRQQIIDSL